MNEQLTISCPRGHGPLAAMVPETLDGARGEVGFCAICGGMWVPHSLVAGMVPEKVRVDLVWAEAGEPCIECSCGRFPGQMTFRTQQVGDVVIDRCDQCVCLWLDGGELEDMGGSGIGDFVAESFSGDASIVKTWGMGGDPGDRVEERSVDGAAVQTWYDDEPKPGDPTRFSWRGELAESSVRGTVGRETSATRLLRKLGISDIEVGDAEFDNEFKVISSDEDSMHAWVARSEVRAALWAVRRRAAGIVSIWREGFEVTGWLSDGVPIPDTAIETACETLYRSLR
jgi:hypothetical protein